LWFTAAWELGQDGNAVYSEWSIVLPALVHQHAVMNGFTTAKKPKKYYGVPELQLIVNFLFRRTRCLDWWKQHMVACGMALLTGVRAGSLAVSQPYKHDPRKQYIQWRCIQFFPNLDGQGGFLQPSIFFSNSKLTSCFRVRLAYHH
jgi:hypothetical protein